MERERWGIDDDVMENICSSPDDLQQQAGPTLFYSAGPEMKSKATDGNVK